MMSYLSAGVKGLLAWLMFHEDTTGYACFQPSLTGPKRWKNRDYTAFKSHITFILLTKCEGRTGKISTLSLAVSMERIMVRAGKNEEERIFSTCRTSLVNERLITTLRAAFLTRIIVRKYWTNKILIGWWLFLFLSAPLFKFPWWWRTFYFRYARKWRTFEASSRKNIVPYLLD